jgi:hypothetical protein
MTGTKKVAFSEQEVSSVRTIRRMDMEEVKELFYQEKDYLRFRADFSLFRAQADQMEYIRRLESMRGEGTSQVMPTKRIHQISTSRHNQYRPSIAINGCAMMA